MVEIQERIFREVGIGDHDAARYPPPRLTTSA